MRSRQLHSIPSQFSSNHLILGRKKPRKESSRRSSVQHKCMQGISYENLNTESWKKQLSANRNFFSWSVSEKEKHFLTFFPQELVHFCHSFGLFLVCVSENQKLECLQILFNKGFLEKLQEYFLQVYSLHSVILTSVKNSIWTPHLPRSLPRAFLTPLCHSLSFIPSASHFMHAGLGITEAAQVSCDTSLEMQT